MLDDMFKICLDPYFKPKHVDDLDRENLFELIYSPGKTINSKEKVNTRREIKWEDLYPEQEVVDEFLIERHQTHKDRLMKIKGAKQADKSPKKFLNSDAKHNTSREEPKVIKTSSVERDANLISTYGFSSNMSKEHPKISRFDSVKELHENKIDDSASRTQTHLPKIRNPSHDTYNQNKFVNKQYLNYHEYVYQAISHN
jgi:hypothetical protein